VGEKDANKPYHGLWERPRLRRSRYLFALAHNWVGLFCVNYTSSSPYCGTGRPRDRFLGIFLFILSRFCKIYGPSQILQKYTSAAMAHRVRDITPWPTAVGATRSWPLTWPRPGALRHSVSGLAPWAAASSPSAVGHDARVQQPI
jgi:hypothetical protein